MRAEGYTMTPDLMDLDGEEQAPEPTPEIGIPITEEAPAQDDLAAHTPAHGLPPAEEHVIACCFLDDGQTFDRAAQEGITAHHFSHPALRSVWLTLSRLRRDKAPLALPSLAEAMGGPQAPWALLLQLTGNTDIPTTAHYAHYAGQLKQAHLRRTLSQVTSLIADRGKDDPDAVAEQIQRTLAQLTAKTQTVTTVSAHLDARRVRLTAPPPEPTTRLFLAGKPIATPGNLVTVIAKSKTGKTASLGAATAAIIGAHYDRTDLDTFKFTAPHTTEAVILIDTEQSPYDAWTCHSRTMARAGNPTEPEWLHHYALVGDSAADLRASLPVALERGKTLHKGVFAVVLDGVADFVASVNDEAECNEFVTYLRKMAVDFDCPIICVIHSNEGIKTGDDGRGHLGKQLTRKAESNLLLKKEGDVTTITSEKQRKAPITEKDGVAFKWDDTAGRHVSCDAPDQVRGGRPSTCSFSDFESIFPRTPEKAMTKEALRRYAVDIAPVSETTFRAILADACENGWLSRLPKAQGFVYYIP
jgi:hypothetical protein